MRAHWCSALMLALAAGAAWADGGLAVDAERAPWPQWQARIGVAAAPLQRPDFGLPVSGGLQLQSARILGDYYFSGPVFAGARTSGGFRATSGVLVSAGGSALSLATIPGGSGNGLSVSRQWQAPSTGVPVDASADSAHTVPYVGVGYTGLSPKGGWGFTADVGLMALNPGSGLRVGRVLSGGQSLDDLVRDLRLTPVLQLGVSYSF